MHYLPGGMCTAWQRKGFTFEGCLHFIELVGSAPAHTYYDLWKELDAVPDTPMIYHDVFHTFRDASGRTLTIHTDADRLEEDLLALSPADAKESKALCTAIKRYAWFIRATGKNPFRLLAKGIGILRGIPLLKKYGSMNIAEYAARFSDPLIRYAISNFFVYPDFSCIAVFFFLAGMERGYPGNLQIFTRPTPMRVSTTEGTEVSDQST